jgi:hypothetical protein
MQSLSRNRSRQGGAVGGMAGMVLRGKPSTSAGRSQRQAPSSRAPSTFVSNPASPAPELTALSKEKWHQLAVLEASGMTASLREGVEGMTRLASPRPTGPRQLTARRVVTLHPSRREGVAVTWF